MDQTERARKHAMTDHVSRLRALRIPAPWLGYALLLALAIYLLTGASGFTLFLASEVVVYAIAAIGQDWLIGRAGQVSIGGAAFLGTGAFVTAATLNTPLHYFPVPLLLSAVVGAAAGLVVGLPALRVGGLYLILTTLAFQYVFQFVAQEYQGDNLAGKSVPALTIGGLAVSSARGQFAVVAVVLVLVVLILHNLFRYAPGNTWSAIREDSLSSQVIGIPVGRWRLLAFVGSSAVTAMAGSLFAYIVGIVSYDTFSLTLGVSIISMVFIGGMNSLGGVLIGATAVTLLPVGLQHLQAALPSGSGFSSWLTTNEGNLATLIFGVVLILVLLFEPSGLVGIARKLIHRVLRGGPARGAAASRASRPAVARPARRPQDAVSPAAGAEAPVTPAAQQQGSRADAHDGSPAPNVLQVRNLVVRYANGALGVSGIDLDVRERSIVAVVGRNGAGKTSTLRAIAGYLPGERVRVSGSVQLLGTELAGMNPGRSGRAGAVAVPERFKVFPSLTVSEHFKAAGIGAARQEELFTRFDALARLARSRAGLLSGGQRQILAIALAVARRPKLLLVDELSLGLAPIMTQSLLAEIVRVRDEDGIAVLLVDQAASALAEVADYYYLLESGQLVGQGSAAEISEQAVRAAVMGG